jgi:hypothetical protein
LLLNMKRTTTCPMSVAATSQHKDAPTINGSLFRAISGCFDSAQ